MFIRVHQSCLQGEFHRFSQNQCSTCDVPVQSSVIVGKPIDESYQRSNKWQLLRIIQKKWRDIPHELVLQVLKKNFSQSQYHILEGIKRKTYRPSSNATKFWDVLEPSGASETFWNSPKTLLGLWDCLKSVYCSSKIIKNHLFFQKFRWITININGSSIVWVTSHYFFFLFPETYNIVLLGIKLKPTKIIKWNLCKSLAWKKLSR